MRVAFLGKGGSGKTTVAAAFVDYLRVQNSSKSVLAIDADINLHLREVIGLAPVPSRLGTGFDDVLAYVKGERSDAAILPRVGSLPPKETSRFIRPIQENPVVQQFASIDRSLACIEVGTYEHHEIGASCFHGKLNALELFLHHTLDTANEWIVVDSTAGTDVFATSLAIAMDVCVFVVEPTNKSVEVFKLFEKTRSCAGHRYPSKVFVMANKVRGSEDEAFIRASIPEEYLIDLLPASEALPRFEQGEVEQKERFYQQTKEPLAKLVHMISHIRRDEQRYYQALGEVFVKECREWVNNAYHGQFESLFDPSFRYQAVRDRLNLPFSS